MNILDIITAENEIVSKEMNRIMNAYPSEVAARIGATVALTAAQFMSAEQRRQLAADIIEGLGSPNPQDG